MPVVDTRSSVNHGDVRGSFRSSRFSSLPLSVITCHSSLAGILECYSLSYDRVEDAKQPNDFSRLHAPHGTLQGFVLPRQRGLWLFLPPRVRSRGRRGENGYHEAASM